MTDSWVSVVRGLVMAGLLVALPVFLPMASPVRAETVRIPASSSANGMAKVQTTTVATLQEVRDHIAVIAVEGNLDKEIDGEFNADPRLAVAQTFYETFPDAFDFLVVFSSFEYETGEDVVAFHVGARNSIAGIGGGLYDNGASFGSEERLQGYVDMAALGRWVSDPQRPGFDFTLGTLAHEVMHQWCCYVDFQASDDPAPRGDLLGLADAHWSYLLDTDASVMYGHDWRDNVDGTFSIVAARRIYSPLDLYVAGFLDPSEVPEFTLIASDDANPDDIPDVSGTIVGTGEPVSVADVIAAEGLRQPASGEAQRDFRAAFVYLVRPGETMSAAQQLAIHRIRAAFGSRFSVLTGGRGVMEVFPPGTTRGDTGEPTPVEGGTHEWPARRCRLGAGLAAGSAANRRVLARPSGHALTRHASGGGGFGWARSRLPRRAGRARLVEQPNTRDARLCCAAVDRVGAAGCGHDPAPCGPRCAPECRWRLGRGGGL